MERGMEETETKREKGRERATKIEREETEQQR